MHNPAKTPQFWIICFALIANTLWLQAQSFDTLVLKNVEKKYITGSLISMQKDYIVYLRQSLPNGPEFRMSKQNVRWIITKDNEVIEVSDKFDPGYRHIDGANSSTEVSKNEQNNQGNAASEKKQEYVFDSRPRTTISPQNKENQVVQFSKGLQSEPSLPKKDFFNFSMSTGISTQRFNYSPGSSADPIFSYAFELGYAGVRERFFLNPTVRIIRKGANISYSLSGPGFNIQFREIHSMFYTDFSMRIGYVLSDNNRKKTILFFGINGGVLIAGTFKGDYEGTEIDLQGIPRFVRGSAEGNIEQGTLGINNQPNTLYRRGGEFGIQGGLLLPVSNTVCIGPTFIYGVSDIFPRLSSGLVGTGQIPEIRSSAFHFTLSFLL
jgi:hypothetical protein